MKKIFLSILFLLAIVTLQAQTYTISSQLKLGNVPAGTTTDPVLVLTPAGIVKQVPSNSLGMSIPHLEYNNTDKTVWNNGKGDVSTNTSFGDLALRSNTTGTGNTAYGYETLSNNLTGNGNSTNGYQSLRDNTDGTNNTANGVSALRSNTTGSSNTAIGANSILNNTSGFLNTAIGTNALLSNTTGFYNTAIGIGADVGYGDLENVTVIGSGAIGNNSNTVTIGNTSVTDNYFSGKILSNAIKTSGYTPIGFSDIQEMYDRCHVNLGSGYVNLLIGSNSNDGTKHIQISNSTGSAVTDVRVNNFGGKLTFGKASEDVISIDGYFNFNTTNLQVYADNAAAISAGLPVGRVYRTSTGVLMVRY